jgi:hypothetical protein
VKIRRKWVGGLKYDAAGVEGLEGSHTQADEDVHPKKVERTSSYTFFLN